ncbi:hypothetical protein B0H16DRAFT_1521151 [Mycena metata]|uniref:DUF6534 domain-containing protein n=1 Tax=Mycena metata TaxID=1033252 RepID=A0AAD7JQ81_9AGAR|nr:hypothetical protein B0H16DRAFT_1521151 [Mycena metata]
MSSPAGTPPFGSIIDVKLLYGPLLIGVFFNMILFGLLLGQMMTYFQSPRRDALWIRILVYYVLFVECSNTALDIAYMYQPLVLEYGAIPDKLPTVFITQPLCVILISFPIQLFFTYRVHALTGIVSIPIAFAVLACISCGGGLWTMSRVVGAQQWSKVPRSYNAAVLWLVSSMVTDLCIAAVLAWALRRKKTGFAATDTVVDRIIRMTVQTGVITAVVNTLDMLSFLFLKGKTINFMWNIPVSKLYSNCMMSTLNARAGFKDTLAAPVVGSLGSLGRTDPKDLDSTDPGVFVAAPRFNSENKDTMVDINNTYQTQDFADDAAYGIRMSRIVERT